jgi:DNA recombination protein RmuC
MEWIPVVIAFVAGLGLGFGLCYLLRVQQSKTSQELVNELLRVNEQQRQANLDAIVNNLKNSFGNISLESLTKASEQFLELAKTKLAAEREIGAKELESKKIIIDQQLEHLRTEVTTERELGSKDLEAKKCLIDQQLQRMTKDLEQISQLMGKMEKDREKKFGELAEQLKNVNTQTSALTQTTNSLREVLASSRARGSWGERIVEDILQKAGLAEGVSYEKQKTMEGYGNRPDFTILLTGGLKLNMDVKFPLDNYDKYIRSESDADRDKYCGDFLRDIRARIREITTREYIDTARGTLDFVLLLIPIESVYAFIHEQDGTIIDEGLKQKVLCCSPVSLIAVLAVVRQAAENLALQKNTNQILSLLAEFNKQWKVFSEKFDILGKRIAETQREYEALTTTRRRRLELPLTRIENIRVERGLPVAAFTEENTDEVNQGKSEKDGE